MLRAISLICVEGKMLRRNDFLKLFGSQLSVHSSVKSDTTVVSDASTKNVRPGTEDVRHAPPPPTPPPPPSRSNRAFTFITAITFTASLAGIYLYRKRTHDREDKLSQTSTESGESEARPSCSPERGDQLPAHAQFLLVGGGTAAFAAMRALRSARPDAQVLLVSPERAPPYMRPPLTKEIWREPDLAERALTPERLTFRQWNGRRRSLLYEPLAFYTPPERLRDAAPGAGLALGWRVVALDPAERTAVLESAAGERAELTYDECLVASGGRPKRIGALRDAAAAGRSLALGSVDDVAALARLLDGGRRTVAVIGGGPPGAELAAALAERARVVHVYRESAPLQTSLPPNLAAEAARALAALGVEAAPGLEVVGATASGDRVRLATAAGGSLEVDAVVECAGTEPDVERLASASRLETHPTLGGLVVNAELAARSGLWAAGDSACYYDAALGRRRLDRHDHAVASGRLAGENMAGGRRPRAYEHRSMFWSDLGPELGYEAIGEIDSKLPTVAVFCEDAVREAKGAATTADGAEARAEGAAAGADGGVRYERGVVFYLRESRVVGVLLWNLFNRMHVARQVLARGEFEDLFEVAKLFSLHEED
ncbi:apoptosis-inducing factor 1, mitochondrial [Pieris rapae]|uniref:apoptosis-inducing factor 1, mitochondrial n=1 Tax=Pieris rapae TaxID=64459 RepID=UPI001E27A58B|nr:apoptosis-inducing factor 1, mitochondrial [Pieris rapae]